MSKDKINFGEMDYRFSFVLTIADSNNNNDDIIICKRDFDIYNFDEDSLYSIELKECIDDVVSLINKDLKSKSRVYTWYNYDKNYVTPEFSTPISSENQSLFKFSFYCDKKLVICKGWSGDFYPFSVRNSVDLTNRKFKNDNRYIEMDFTKQIAQKASADKQDLTSIIMRHISSTCASFKAKQGYKKFVYKQTLPEICLENVVFSNEKGAENVNHRIKSNKTVVDDYGYEKTVYESYQTVYNVGGKEYNLKSFNK